MPQDLKHTTLANLIHLPAAKSTEGTGEPGFASHSRRHKLLKVLNIASVSLQSSQPESLPVGLH